MIDKPFYKGRPVGTVAVLAKVLGTSEVNLQQLAARSNSLFKTRTIQKNGKSRVVYDALPQLKGIHEKINSHFLRHVEYPYYLHGGLKEKDYVTDCKLHFKTKRGITQDISNFFPSIQLVDVKRIWQYFFKFPPVVANLLSELTTLNGYIPQGAKTSGFLANLLFWETESDLVHWLKQRGFRYTRFVDDITITTQNNITDDEKNEIIKMVRAMFRRHGLKPSRKKSLIQTGLKAITAHGLQIASRTPSKNKIDRNNLRAWLHRLEQQPIESLNHSELQSLSGKLVIVRRLHTKEGLALKTRLDALWSKLRALETIRGESYKNRT